MPKQAAIRRARADARKGKDPDTQAGEFVREQMRELKKGKGMAKSQRQAIAIGLSEARREGVPIGPPKRGKVSAATRRKARRDSAVGKVRKRPAKIKSRNRR
jgi:hypothetical protein